MRISSCDADWHYIAASAWYFTLPPVTQSHSTVRAEGPTTAACLIRACSYATSHQVASRSHEDRRIDLMAPTLTTCRAAYEPKVGVNMEHDTVITQLANERLSTSLAGCFFPALKRIIICSRHGRFSGKMERQKATSTRQGGLRRGDQPEGGSTLKEQRYLRLGHTVRGERSRTCPLAVARIHLENPIGLQGYESTGRKRGGGHLNVGIPAGCIRPRRFGGAQSKKVHDSSPATGSDSASAPHYPGFPGMPRASCLVASHSRRSEGERQGQSAVTPTRLDHDMPRQRPIRWDLLRRKRKHHIMGVTASVVAPIASANAGLRRGFVRWQGRHEGAYATRAKHSSTRRSVEWKHRGEVDEGEAQQARTPRSNGSWDIAKGAEGRRDTPHSPSVSLSTTISHLTRLPLTATTPPAVRSTAAAADAKMAFSRRSTSASLPSGISLASPTPPFLLENGSRWEVETRRKERAGFDEHQTRSSSAPATTRKMSATLAENRADDPTTPNATTTTTATGSLAHFYRAAPHRTDNKPETGDSPTPSPSSCRRPVRPSLSDASRSHAYGRRPVRSTLLQQQQQQQ
ncbi:hypothetical protein CMUS01_08312 [Colletotrichum musicola]|uniref:Uncharacterized protein n=1 Tax=Colletotrichum musicola TaxID=2175873 RepID=A0A8H6KCR0_9PEZI|nr:hypothetical protein CMUS01_08312 [Colletotrichum musicola]